MVFFEAPIHAVNIYNNHARVTRRGQVRLEPGEHILSIGDLPASLENDSVRVMSPNAAVKIADVEITTRTLSVTVPAEMVELQAAFDELQDRDEALRDDDRVEAEQLAFLQDIRNAASRSLGESIAGGNTPLENMDALMEHIAVQQRKSQTKRRSIHQERRKLDQQMRLLQAKAPTGFQLMRRSDAQHDAPAAPFTGNPFTNDAQAEQSAGFRRANHPPAGLTDENQQPASRFGQRPSPFLPPRADNQRKSLQITVQVEEVTDFELVVTYSTPDARWEPFYDVRVVNGEFIVSFMANIRQRTGENWPEVPVVLSTARPIQNANLPRIRPWMIDAEDSSPPAPLLQRRPTFGGRLLGSQNQNEDNNPRRSPFSRPALPPAPPPPPAPSSRPSLLNRVQPPPPPAPPERAFNLEMEPGELAGAAPAVTFVIDQPLAVPSDNSVRKAFITTLSLEGELDYIAIPSQAEEAFLCARIKNTSDVTLLPGHALIFFGSQYVGKTDVKAVAPGETLSVQVGERERIRVRRQLTEHAATKPSAENFSRTEFIYRITLANETVEPIGLTVLDHLPFSRNKNIKVLVRAVSPQPVEQTELNIFRWRIELLPGERQEIVLGFAVEHPKDMKIVSKRS